METKQTIDERIRSLYLEVFPVVARFICSRGGSRETARDIFHDALIVLWERGEKEIASVPAFLVQTCKNMWHRNRRDEDRRLRREQEASEDEHEEVREESLLSLLRQSGERCMDLLSDHYFFRLSLKELAERHGFSGERSAAAQKHKCIARLRSWVKQKMISKKDLYHETC